MGTFRPFSLDYRFAGTLHPNSQAIYCATMALAAICLAQRARRGRLLLWLLCFVAITLLALTKSRTLCAAFLTGVAVLASLSLPWRKQIFAGAGMLGVGCAVVLSGSLLGWGGQRQAVDIMAAGREEDEAGSFSGRTPLWAALAPHAEEHLLLGHGYQTFWDPQRIADFSQAFEWGISHGHCGYLDAVLELGVIGAALAVAVVFSGIYISAGCYRASGDAGYGFLFALLICRAVFALLESPLVAPTGFTSFIMICGLMHMAFYREATGGAIAPVVAKEVAI